MKITRIFLGLAIFGALLAIAALLLAFIKVKKEKRGGAIGLSVLTLMLFVATLVCAIIVFNVYAEDLEYYLEYGYDYTPSLGWVVLGLGCGTVSLGPISILAAIVAMKSKDEEEIPEPGSILSKDNPNSIITENFVLLSASSNVGIGFWTSICVACAALFGVESKNYTKKMERAANAVKARLQKQMNKYPDFDFSDFRIVKEGKLTYTGTVIGNKKKINMVK